MRLSSLVFVLLLTSLCHAQPQRIERNVARSKATLTQALSEAGWKDGETIAVQGRTNSGDGGGSQYYYDADSVVAVDGVFTLPGKGGVMSYDTNGVFDGASGTGRLIAVDKKTVRLTQAGGVSDWDGSTGTDNTPAIRAAIAACQTVGATLIIDGKFKITEPITLALEQPITITGRTGEADSQSLIVFDSDTDGASAFNFYSSSTSSADYWHIRDLHISTTTGTNLSAFGHSTDGADADTPRRGVKARFERLEISSSGYAFEFSNQPYAVQPIFRDIDVTGGGAIKITPDPTQTVFHANSCAIIEGFHYSAGSTKKGAAFHLEGCRKVSILGAISEGQRGVDTSISPYTGAIHFYLKDVTDGIEMRNIWTETGSGTLEAGAYNLILESGGASAGSCTVSQFKMDGNYESLKVVGSARLIMRDSFMFGGNFPTIEVDPGANVTFQDYYFASPGYVRALVEMPNVTVINAAVTDHIAQLNSSNEFYTWPDSSNFDSKVLYSYMGGYFSNETQKTRNASSWYPAHTLHKPQNDPVMGPTLLIEKNGSGFAVLWQTIEQTGVGIDFEDYVGRQVFYRVVARLPHINLASQNFEIQWAGGTSREVGQTTFTDTNNWDWQTIVGSKIVESGDSLTSIIEIDAVSTDPEFIQLAAIDVALGSLPPISRRTTARSYRGLTDSLGVPGAPGEGTWIVGDEVLSQAPSIDGIYGWLCTASGTSRTITSVTGNTTSGSNQLTSIANITELIPGDFISLTGNSGTYRIVSIDDATTATLSANATATVTGSAVSAVGPIWQEIPIGEVLRPDMQGYAQISVEDNATATTVASTQTDWSAKSQFTGFTANASESNGATPDHANDHITITDAGVWEVQAVLTLSGSVASDLWELAFFVDNGALKLTPKQGVNIISAGFTYSNQVTVSGLATFAENDTVELWVQRTNGTGTLTITNAVMTAKKVSD